MAQKQVHEAWTSRFAYILVTIGATVGLGNLWRFPHTAGEYGGGAFVLVYLFAVFVIAAPLFMAETVIGRAGRLSPPGTMAALAKAGGLSRNWKYLGFGAMFTSMLVLSFFSVFGGITLAFTAKAASGAFSGLDQESVGAVFSSIAGDPKILLFWTTIFAVANALIVGTGIRRGIERVGKILMPMLFLLLVLLVIYAAVVGDFGRALHFLFNLDFSNMNSELVWAAFGQAFFTMSIGSGGILIYGSYIKQPISIGRTTLIVALGDTLVAVLAGLAIFPIVFAYGIEPGDYKEVVFRALPIAFANMPLGGLVGFLFFLLFGFAAITSTVGLLEVSVSWMVERRKWSRMASAFILTAIFWVVGILSVLSFNVLSKFHPLEAFAYFKTMTFLDLFDFLVSHILLGVGGFLFALFAGWKLSKKLTEMEIGFSSRTSYRWWLITVRYIAPLVILALFTYKLLSLEGSF